MSTSRRIRGRIITSLAAGLVAASCARMPTAPDAAHAGAFVASQGTTLAKPGGGGGKPAPGYIVRPLRVTFLDRPGDNYTSDDGGPYTNGLDGTWGITDYADPSRPDHFLFHPDPDGPGDRLTRLSVPGAVPPTDCGYFRFSVRDENTPDLYGTTEGWTGTGSGTLLCGSGRKGHRLEIGACVAVTHDLAGRWTVTADACATEVWDGSGKGAAMLGVFPVSFAFEAIEQ